MTKIRYRKYLIKSLRALDWFGEKFKPMLCYQNRFSDFFYPLWRDINCDCCAFFRGVFLTSIIFSVILFLT